MRATTALAAFSAAFAVIATSCDSGSTPPSAPKEEGRYCEYNKNYYNDYNYYNYCPSVLCAYTGYNMTGYDYDSGRCVPPVANSSSTPRSSSSVRPRSSSAACSPWYMCRCSDKYKFVLEETKKVMNCYSGPCLVSIQKSAADAAECVLE